jgi:tripartite-type tricarboxylate transporter receptor subunit TctC
MLRRVLALFVTFVLTQSGIMVVPATAQTDWPSRPITIIVPSTAGSATDVVTRMIAREMSKRLGQPIVIENRAGGDGVIGTKMAVRSVPDGYTLTLGANSSYIGAPIFADGVPPYDPTKDLQPISLVGRSPYLLVVYPGLGVSSVDELVKLAKSKPGVLNYSSIGEYSYSRFGMLTFAQRKGLDLAHIPYKSSAQSVIDLAAGVIHLQLATIPPAMSLYRNGTLKVLAVTSAKRIALLPEIPTMQESGVPDYDVAYWLAMFAPANTSRSIVDKLNLVLRESLVVPELQAALAVQGFEAEASSPERMSEILQRDIETFRNVFTRANSAAEKK